MYKCFVLRCQTGAVLFLEILNKTYGARAYLLSYKPGNLVQSYLLEIN